MMTQSGLQVYVPVASSSTQYTSISELKPFLKSINIKVIVLHKTDSSITKDGHQVHTFLVGDQSGSILLNLWDEKGAAVKPADILQILGGFVTLYKGFIRFACRVGSITRTGSFAMRFKAEPNMSLAIWAPDSKNPDQFVCRLPKMKSNLSRRKIEGTLVGDIASSSEPDSSPRKKHRRK